MLKQKKVLVIEDDRNAVLLFESHLKGHVGELIIASTVEEASELVPDYRPSVIIAGGDATLRALLEGFEAIHQLARHHCVPVLYCAPESNSIVFWEQLHPDHAFDNVGILKQLHRLLSGMKKDVCLA